MNTMKTPLRWFRALVTALIWVSLFSPFNKLPDAQALSTDIVISQVYGGGGNSGAAYRNDFIELYNLGAGVVDVTGWTVQYTSAAGTTWTSSTLLSGSIAPGQYYLVQEAAGAGGMLDLPTPDAIGAVAMSSSSGKVALVSSSTPLAGGCPLAQAVDFVGYGAADCAEGDAAAPSLNNTSAAIRAANGCIETDHNNLDFASGSPNPRNSGSPIDTCPADPAPAVTSTSPVPGAIGSLVNVNIRLTFSEPVNTSAGWFTLSCEISGAHTAAVTGGPLSFTLDPDVDFQQGETCTVTVLNDHISDADPFDPPDTMASNFVWSFRTLAERPSIHDIQGAGHASSAVGAGVVDVPGIVTALNSNGFTMQEPNADGDPATSEGIFVYLNAAPTVRVGDSVVVSGTVAEFRPGNNAESLSVTEINLPVVSFLSSGNTLPEAVIIGEGGRVPPQVIIEDDASGDVEISGTFDPDSDGLDFYESLEGMRVEVRDAVVVGPTNPSGEVVIVADNGANAGLRTQRGGVIVQTTDFNPERIILDDEVLKDLSPSRSMPEVNVGAAFPGMLEGVMSYSSGNYKLEVTRLPDLLPGSLVQQTAPAGRMFHLSVASFNVENLDPGDSHSKFTTLADLVVNHLQSPDLIALEEVQDNNGATNDGVVAADQTLSALITAIQAAGGPTYNYRQINPIDNQDGGEMGGNIRVAFLFRIDQGLSFVDRPAGGSIDRSTTPVEVQDSASGPRLSWSPGRIDPGNSAFSSSRKPLVGEFLYFGERLFVIANHFTSKGSDQPLFGRFQPPALSSEVKRTRQAEIVHTFVDSILALNEQANVIVLGDFNDFPFSTPLAALKGSSLFNLAERLPVAERYSYVYEGNSQALDHILVSTAINNRPLVFQPVHVNAEFADRSSDHDPLLATLEFDLPGYYLPIILH